MSRSWSNIPFAPRRCPFFYGWVIVAGAVAGTIASIPGQTMGVGVFTDFLIEALGLSRVRLSTAYMLGTIASSFLLPFAGKLVDRVGARAMAAVSSLGLAASVALLSRCDRLAFAMPLPPSAAAFAMVFLCFLSLRFFGQGCLTLTSRVMLGKWFEYRRGLASAISGLFISFAFNGSPRLLDAMVSAYGWRGACLVLAAGVGGGMTLIALLFFRDKPEDCGLVMDGIDDPAWRARMAAKVPETVRDFTRAEAARTIAFWAYSLALASQGLVVTAVTFHIASLGQEAGLDRQAAYAVFLPMSFFGVTAHFFGGWLSDRIRLKWLLHAMMAAQALGTAGLLNLATPQGRWMMIIGYGIAGGGFGLLSTVVFPRYFGRTHLGAISGLNVSVMVFASAIGPVFFSALHELTGSYQAVIALCWFMPLGVMLLGLRAVNPQQAERARR